MKQLTNALNRDLEARLSRRFVRVAEEQPQQAPPQDAAPVEADPRSHHARQLEELRGAVEGAHRKCHNLAGELARRRLNESQFEDPASIQDWLEVTEGIAAQLTAALSAFREQLQAWHGSSTEFNRLYPVQQ